MTAELFNRQSSDIMVTGGAATSRKARVALRTGVIVAGASLLLAGCGGGDETTPAPTPPAPTPPLGPRPGAGHCPGSTSEKPATCSEEDCCPGFEGSGDKTFPCPSMSPENYSTCEGGLDTLVDALLFSLTRDEKHKFLRGVGWENSWDSNPGYFIGNAAIGLPFGIPSQNMMDNGNGMRNDRLTIESKKMLDSGNGGFEWEVEQVTSFPVSLAVASLWSEADVERVGEALGKEFKAKGANVLLGPAVNVHRVPRNGRNAEYMSGESPYLGARLIKPYIKSVQKQGVLCSVKHFINNNQEACRRSSDSIVDNRTRWQVYYPPFEAAVQADVAMQMCGYNFVNGIPNCGSKNILLRDLKGALNFKGWVQSDWWATYSFDVVEAGIDQEMPGSEAPGNPDYTSWFTDANLATLTNTKVDQMVRPQLTYMAKYGLFVPHATTCQAGGGCDGFYYKTDVRTAESEALAKEMATKAVTLLKNGIVGGGGKALPFSNNPGKILLLGSACNLQTNLAHQVQLWTNASYYHIGGSGKVITKKPITILKGLQDMCAKAEYTCEVKSVDTDDVDAALAEAEAFQPNVAIACGGVTSSEEIDRLHLEIDQSEFVVNVTRDLAAAITKVVLTMTAGTIVMPWIDNADAMVNVFLPGKFAGAAFADVLFGVSNPSAKTPIAYPIDEADTIKPCACDQSLKKNPCEYTEKLKISWMGMATDKILFPFGFGLSYTTYTYSNPLQYNTKADVDRECPTQDSQRGAAIVCVTAQVANTGNVDGEEIAQLYLGFPGAAGEPPKLLRGFHRLSLTKAGGSSPTDKASFPLYERDLQIWDEQIHGWKRPAGTFTAFVGKSSDDPDELTLTLTVPQAAQEYV